MKDYLNTIVDQFATPETLSTPYKRNLSHQAFLIIGFGKCCGVFIAINDDDLQGPTEILPEVFRRLCLDVDVVSGIRR